MSETKMQEDMARLARAADVAEVKMRRAEQALRDEARVPASELRKARTQRDALLAALERASKELHDASSMLLNQGKEFQAERFGNSAAEARAAIAAVEKGS